MRQIVKQIVKQDIMAMTVKPRYVLFLQAISDRMIGLAYLRAYKHMVIVIRIMFQHHLQPTAKALYSTPSNPVKG